MAEIISASNLQDMKNIRHGFFTRAWGDGSLGEGLVATDNRRHMAEALGTTGEKLLSCYQVHSPDVVTVSKIWDLADRPRADGLVTNVVGVALSILTADCVPVLFADSAAGVIGACHAGWRGAVSGVIENTVAAMEKLGANRRTIHAAIGACIWQNSYEVGPEFPAPFLAENPDNDKFFRPAFKSDHYMFNLPAYAEAKLRALNLASVEASPADTCANINRFFSHRHATLTGIPRGGNLLSALMIAA